MTRADYIWGLIFTAIVILGIYFLAGLAIGEMARKEAELEVKEAPDGTVCYYYRGSIDCEQ